MRPDATPRFTRSPHLVDLVADAERLAASVAGADLADDRLDPLRDEAALASLRLDGSTARAVPDLDAVAGDDVVARTAGSGTWADALRLEPDELEDAPDDTITALELLGVRAALASDDLAERLLTAPLDTLVELHRRLTRRLLDEDTAGRPRRSEQAVHDASVGRILYFPTEPDDIPGEVATLCGWLDSAGTREHALVVSGVLHHELLRIHPFEAANGRLARAASRLVLRARGLDPAAAAPIEVELDRDGIGYYEEVARSVRRRDLTIWLERWGEAVTGGLRRVAREAGLLTDPLPDRATAFVDGRSGGFTVADYRAGTAAGKEEARTELARLLDAGRIDRVPGARGLRFTLV
jgi:fido (protein-threonine AMPylation protein)